MLISFENIVSFLNAKNIKVSGVFHVGAHECEELNAYVANGVKEDAILWVEGNTEIFNRIKSQVKNVINEMVDETTGKELPFYITNNGQSSSILSLGTHMKHHPDVFVVETKKCYTKTIKDIGADYNIDFKMFNFWNFDIQGAELRALKGAGKLLENVQALYVEVNTEKVYVDCPLVEEIDAYVETFGLKRVMTNLTSWGWGDALYVK
uniref:Methyltransferase FkbM domain-containing protein n=1 Tax=viral metagenome TaxID=1070528 RepID=A0A6C0KPU1_9ZZZZ